MTELYCVTFEFDKKMCWAVRGIKPQGVFSPEKRCALSRDDAFKLYQKFKSESSFKNIAVRKLPLKKK